MKLKTKDPSKQRKMLYILPYHRRNKLFSAHLSTELKGTYNFRSLPVRKGDTVRVSRGDYKGYEGKISRVDRKKYRIYIEGINREKADGTSVHVPIHPSKVEIVRLNLDDKWRNKIIERKKLKEKEKKPEKDTKNKEIEKPKNTKNEKQDTKESEIMEEKKVNWEREAAKPT